MSGAGLLRLISTGDGETPCLAADGRSLADPVDTQGPAQVEHPQHAATQARGLAELFGDTQSDQVNITADVDK